MTLIVETGTFNPNSNSYASVSDADARISVSTGADAWENYDPQQKEQRLITATRRLDTMFDWFGEPLRRDQPLGWPRRNLTDMRGRSIIMLRVPVKVRDATIDLALWLPEEVATATAAEDVIEQIVLGPIELKMAVPETTTATVRPYVPYEIVTGLRNFGEYLGGGVGTGRLVR